jgi:hypothetical protein
MYREVTVAIRGGIEADEFEDGERMVHLDEVFANRYLDAFDAWKVGEPMTAAWSVAFDGLRKWRPVVIQDLLAGMNAHINLDLGIASATVAPRAELPTLERDFGTINDILAGLLDGFVEGVAEVSPWIGLLDRVGGRTDQAIIKFAITVARQEAWEFASDLAGSREGEWGSMIDERDALIARLGRTILRPGPLLSASLFVIKLRERRDVRRVIDVLGDVA